MTSSKGSGRRRNRTVWTHERLIEERAFNLGCVLDPASRSSYSSASESYIEFCQWHNFPFEPTPDTLSLYVAYTCHHINPRSVRSYLSGICNNLEPFYPNIRSIRQHPLVQKTLKGAMKRKASVINRKKPLTWEELTDVFTSTTPGNDHDSLLFLAILFTAFFALMRLGELVWPDKVAHREFRKVTLRSSVAYDASSFSFTLPTHKADREYNGNTIRVDSTDDVDDPHRIFLSYLQSRDSHFPAHPQLWVRADGSIPTRSWFIRRLRGHFSSNVAGHSLRSGGATHHAKIGTPLHVIQALGRWASDTFRIYIREHSAILAAILSKH